MDVEVGQLWKSKDSNVVFEVMDVRPHKRYKHAITVKYGNGTLQLRYPNHFAPHICGWELVTEETYGMILLKELP